ncbi:hypothetical protein ACROYT_G037016 [Oculina patagonica]
MAGFIQPDNFQQIYTPNPSKDTLHQPCDVVLVVGDGKTFKAHRKVLSQASPFFEKLLNSDMKESKEGVVRLEMFSESVMAATLEFIYTGHVQILAEDNARDLIVMADYFFLHKLKLLVEGVLAQKLNTSNCISTYYFSERYQCEELLSKTKRFILVNFSALYAVNREDVLHMSNKEVEMWISSDDIDVSAEGDVFKFILAWVDHDKNKRKKYFAELFRHVRLVYVSRDFLINDVVTNDLVKENEGCLDLVKDALVSIDSKNCENLSVPARKSLETPAIVIRTRAELLCYFPREDSWCRLGKIPKDKSRSDNSGEDVRGDLSDVDRYDLSKGQWDKVTDIQVARKMAHGAAVKGKIFIAGGYMGSLPPDLCTWTHDCEMYNEETNEWQFIASLKKPSALVNLVETDGKMYAVSSPQIGLDLQQFSIECYNPEENKWEMKSEPVFPGISFCMTALNACSMRIFKGVSHIRPLKSSTSDSLSVTTTTHASSFHKTGKRKYVDM